MTARDRLDLARLPREPAQVTAPRERAAPGKDALVVADPAPVWPWVLLVLVAGLLTAAAVVPHAEPIAQIADGSEE